MEVIKNGRRYEESSRKRTEPGSKSKELLKKFVLDIMKKKQWLKLQDV